MSEVEYIVESDIIIRAVDKPFSERQILGSFPTAEMAYTFIEKYLADTKDLHTYFSRIYLCSKEEYPDRIKDGRLIAINVVLGQFEDMIYIKQDSTK
jgi:hypothetical protein